MTQPMSLTDEKAVAAHDCDATLRWMNRTPDGPRTWAAAKAFGGAVGRFHEAILRGPQEQTP